MSESDDRPESMTLRDIVEDFAEEVQAARAAGEAILTGPASVQLTLRVEDALTPQEAVMMVINRIARVGFDAFTIAVTDMLSGEDYFVQGGQLVTLEQLRAAVEESERE